MMTDTQIHKEFAFVARISDYPFLAAIVRRCELAIVEDETGLSISLQLPAEFKPSSFNDAFIELEIHGKEVFNRDDVRLIVWKTA